MTYEAIDRYIRTVRRLRKRYTVGGWIAVQERGVPSVYTRYEAMAWARYLKEVDA